MKAVVLFAALLAASSQAVAGQPAGQADSDAEELTITSRAACLEPKHDPTMPPPHVVSTFPARGAVVRPGMIYVRATFDEPMSCRGFFAAIARMRSPCSQARQNWVLSFDRKTIRTLCYAEPSSAYGLRVSAEPKEARFVSLAGRDLEPYDVTFTTSAGPLVQTTGDAIDQDVEMLPPPPMQPLPLQEWRGKR